MITDEIMTMDTNGNGSLDYEDDIDSEHLDIAVEYCDNNQDG